MGPFLIHDKNLVISCLLKAKDFKARIREVQTLPTFNICGLQFPEFPSEAMLEDVEVLKFAKVGHSWLRVSHFNHTNLKRHRNRCRLTDQQTVNFSTEVRKCCPWTGMMMINNNNREPSVLLPMQSEQTDSINISTLNYNLRKSGQPRRQCC